MSSRKRPVEELRGSDRDVDLDKLEDEPDAFDPSLTLEDLFPAPKQPTASLAEQREFYRTQYTDVSLRLKQMEEHLQYYLRARQVIAGWKKRWNFTVCEASRRLEEENAKFANIKEEEKRLAAQITETEGAIVSKRQEIQQARSEMTEKEKYRDKLQRELSVLAEELANWEALLRVRCSLVMSCKVLLL